MVHLNRPASIDCTASERFDGGDGAPKQLLLCSSEYLPARQLLQSEAPAAEYVPAAQFAHSSAPATALYVPGTHAEHAKPSCVYPATQKQLSLPASESAFAPQFWHRTKAVLSANLPVSHSAHAVDPDVALNLPGVQAEHSPAEPVYPASQTHSVLPAAELELAGQASQVYSDRAPIAVETVPAGQLAHSPVP